TRAPATCRASETGHRLSVKPGRVEERRGPPRFLDRPLRTCHGRTPRRIRASPRPPYTERPLLPSSHSAPWASGKRRGFGAACPMARTFACLRIAEAIAGPVARLTTGSGGLTLGRTGFAPAGRQTKFHEGIVSSLPFDQHCLVALHFLYSYPDETARGRVSGVLQLRTAAHEFAPASACAGGTCLGLDPTQVVPSNTWDGGRTDGSCLDVSRTADYQI